MTARFEVGRTYSAVSAADHTCVWRFTVVSRTPKFVTIRDDSGRVKRVGVRVRDGDETALPLGRYSMAPVIRASRAL